MSKSGEFETSRRFPSRREFFHILQAFFGATFLPQWSDLLTPENLPLQESLLNQELVQDLERLIGNQYAGVSIAIIEDGEVVEEMGVNPDHVFPIASAFKSAVLLYYLLNIPQELWHFDKGDLLYNMIVYSHNTATSHILGEVGQHLRDQGNTGNNLELFNNFLSNQGMAPMLSRWGYGEPTEGLHDPRAEGTLQVGGDSLFVSNVTTLRDLSQFYVRFLQMEPSLPPEVSAAFRTLTGITDLRYLSPLEKSFQGQQFFGKDGYLTSHTFKAYGSTKIDSGVLMLGENRHAVYALATFNTSEVLSEQLAQRVSGSIHGEKAQQLKDTAMPTREKLPYFFTGDERIDQEGEIVPSDTNLRFLDEALASLDRGNLGYLITLNLFDGVLSGYQVQDGVAVPNLVFPCLVGERLPYGDQKYSEQFSQSQFAWTGEYDGKNGVFQSYRPTGIVPQHTFTTPMIGVFEGLAAANGFGDLNTAVPVPFLALRSLNYSANAAQSDMQGFSLSSLHSEVTVHAIPQLSSQDSAFDHFSQRAFVTERLGEFLENHGSRPLGFDSNWSHGCLNATQSNYNLLSVQAESARLMGKSVAVVLTYHGLEDWSTLCLPPGFNSSQHPFYGENLRNSVGSTFASR